MIPKAVCPKCGKVYYGWALLYKKHRYCECGYALGLVEEK